MYCIFYVYKSFCCIWIYDLVEVELVVLYLLGLNVIKLDKFILMLIIFLICEYLCCDVLLFLIVIIIVCGGFLK